jgi:uncharacterized repeat protein (TIGR01451 family)
MKRVTYCDLNKKQDKLLGCDGQPLPCNAKVLQCDDLPEPVTPTPNADLAVAKTVSPSKVAPGGAVVFTVVATNAGPDAANGAVVADNILSNYLDATSATVVTVTYAGGAAGPATTTVGALATGVAITTFPMGGVATFSIPTTVKADAPAAQIVNTASVRPPAGVEDTKPGNNNSAAVVDVEQCYLKCDEGLVRSNTAGAVGGTGIGSCILLTASGPAVYQSRDDTIQGSAVETIGNPQYLQVNIQNPFPTGAIVNFRLSAFNHCVKGDPIPATRGVSFVHAVSEELLIAYPMYAAHPQNATCSWATVFPGDLNSFLGPWDDITNYSNFTQAAVSSNIEYDFYIAPLATKTLYVQFWVVIREDGVFSAHAGGRVDFTIMRNAI